MSFWSFINDIFGLRNAKEPNIKSNFGNQTNDSFLDPSWQHDENEFNIRPYFGENSNFSVFGNPSEMIRFFESQINHMLIFMSEYDNKVHGEFMNIPFMSPHQETLEQDLRSKMLKPNSDNLSPTIPKKDTDLDGLITADNFPKFWDKRNQIEEPKTSSFITGKCVIKEFVRGPDGTIKQKQTIRDHEGNEETTISQQTGDKIYTAIIKKDKNGVETKTENFISGENSELTDGKLLLKNEPSFNIGLNIFPWEKFFNPNPKL